METGMLLPLEPEEDLLDLECLHLSAIEADEILSLETIRGALRKIPGSLTADFIAEREEV